MLKTCLSGLVLLCVVMACGCIGGTQSAKSVELRGYNFTLTDAGDWQTDNTSEDATDYQSRWTAGTYGGFDISAMQRDLWSGWHGSVLPNAFYIPDKNGKLDQGNSPGIVSIYVLDVPDANDLTYDSALEESAWLSNEYLGKDSMLGDDVSKEATSLDGRDAYLIQEKKLGMASVAVQLSPNIVAVIGAYVDDDDAWAILEKITISKSS